MDRSIVDAFCAVAMQPDQDGRLMVQGVRPFYKRWIHSVRIASGHNSG